MHCTFISTVCYKELDLTLSLQSERSLPIEVEIEKFTWEADQIHYSLAHSLDSSAYWIFAE